MSVFQNIIIISIIALIINGILSTIFKNNEKLDKGVVFTYYRLSFRRRVIRTLWMFPILLIGIIIMCRYADLTLNESLTIIISTLILFLLQLTYNYTRWKKYERQVL